MRTFPLKRHVLQGAWNVASFCFAFSANHCCHHHWHIASPPSLHPLIRGRRSSPSFSSGERPLWIFFRPAGNPWHVEPRCWFSPPGGQSKKFNHQFVGRGCLIAISNSASHSGPRSFFPSLFLLSSFQFFFFFPPLPWWHHDGYKAVEGPASAGR